MRKLRYPLPRKPREPGINVTESGLPCFETYITRDNGAVNLTAYPTDKPAAYLPVPADGDVASRGAHDLYQGAGSDSRPDRTHMAVDRSYTDGYAFSQAKSFCPLRAQSANLLVTGDRIPIETIPENTKQGIDFRKEFHGRKTVPGGVPHSLVTGETAAPGYCQRVRIAGKQSGNPVTMLHPGPGTSLKRRGRLETMEHFRPNPFTGISAPAVGSVIRIPSMGDLVYPVRFLDGSMVLPKHEHGVRILSVPGKKGQRHP